MMSVFYTRPLTTGERIPLRRLRLIEIVPNIIFDRTINKVKPITTRISNITLLKTYPWWFFFLSQHLSSPDWNLPIIISKHIIIHNIHIYINIKQIRISPYREHTHAKKRRREKKKNTRQRRKERETTRNKENRSVTIFKSL